MDSLIELLSIDGYIPVNKDLAKLIGINEAIIVGELLSEYRYWRANNGLTEDGYFYSTVENIETNTTLNEYLQRKVLKHLIDLKIIDIQYRRDKLRFFKINTHILEVVLKTKSLEFCDSLKSKEPNLKELKKRNSKNLGQIIITNNNKDNKEVVEGVNDLGAFAHLNRNNQQQTTSNSTNNEFAEKDIQDHLTGEGSVETARSATMTPQGVGREGGASQPDGAKPRKKFYYIKDLDKQTLENLKQDMLENRFQEEGSLTYRDIQKKYNLIDNLEFDTPLYIDSLLTLREQGEKQEKTGIRYY